MTEHEWLKGTRPRKMISDLKKFQPELAGPTQRKLRLLSCAISRFMFAEHMEPEINDAIVVAESAADVGDAAKVSTASASAAVRLLELVYCYLKDNTNQVAIMWISSKLRSLIEDELHCDRGWRERLEEGVEQSRLVRDVFCNPFRPVFVDPRWLTKNVLILARTVYEDSSFDKLPLLADALEEAGCSNADLLAHCRAPGPHVRGCWAVDLMLGKK